MTRWFVSDHHLDHWNIIKYANRPFATTDEMNEFLIKIHNDYVKPSDHVSFLGDVTLRRGGRVDKEWFVKMVKRFNGHKRLFLGNHDHFPVQTYLEAGFEKIYATWRDDSGIIYSHIPLHPKQLFSCLANVHGHIHQNKSPESVAFIDSKQRIREVPYINVCVEATNYRPLAHEELMNMIKASKSEYEGVNVGDVKGGEDA